MEKKQKQLEELVFTILSKSEKARNNDNFLILKVMHHHGQDIKVIREVSKVFPLPIVNTVIVWRMTNINDLPSFESITRARRKIQASGQFLPTNPEVIKVRRIKERSMYELYRK